MPATKKKNEINLIPQDKFAASTVGKLLNWLLSTFRVIVIFVEMVVMIAFLSRFWLDAKNSDLNDEIKQKQALLIASKNFETQFKETQDKLTIMSALTKNPKLTDVLANLPTIIPDSVYLKSVAFDGLNLRLDGESPSEALIDQLVTNLEGTPRYTDTNLSQVGNNQDNGMITFKINTKMK
jgi:Tfp pilus assembly protein PilN